MTVIRPKVGIGLFLVRGDKVLLGKRLGSHGAGQYGGTGGHLENGETIQQCALRELAEEAGPDIKVKNLRFLCVTNFKEHLPKHYVDVTLAADWVSGEPKVMEPDKRASWDWYDINNPPKPLFGVMRNYIEAYKTGKTFYET